MSFNRVSTDRNIPAVFTWTVLAPANGEIVDDLLTVIARYPHLAGRLSVDEHGMRCFHLNNAGVLVTEADANLTKELARDVNELSQS
jgi:shikimate O-hydroxycinnamoyltransferase